MCVCVSVSYVPLFCGVVSAFLEYGRWELSGIFESCSAMSPGADGIQNNQKDPYKAQKSRGAALASAKLPARCVAHSRHRAKLVNFFRHVRFCVAGAARSMCVVLKLDVSERLAGVTIDNSGLPSCPFIWIRKGANGAAVNACFHQCQDTASWPHQRRRRPTAKKGAGLSSARSLFEEPSP